MRLTDLQIKNCSLPTGATKQKTFFDDTLKGFGLRVSVGGAKSFVVMYGKRRKLKTIGRYPDISLADARVEARKLIGEVAARPDDFAAQGASLPFLVARDRFLEDARARNKESTFGEYRRLLRKHFTFEKPLGQVSRQDIMDVVAELKDVPSTANHAYVAIRTLMNWAVHRGLIAASPVPSMKFKTVTRSRVLSDEELSKVWHRGVQEGHPYGTLVLLLILTGQRRGEIAGLRRSWIIDDAITFPAGFCKNKREHKIPIAPLTKQILESFAGNSDLLFPARGHDDVPFSGWSKAKRAFDKPLGIAEWTLHDLRRTYSSNLAKLGVAIHVTEKLLNHVSGTISGVAAVYNRHSYWDEMRRAAERHDDLMSSVLK